MANSLKAALMAAGIAVAAQLEPNRKAHIAGVVFEEQKRAECNELMQRLLAREFELTRPKWIGKPRLSIQDMMQRDFYSKVGQSAPQLKLTSQGIKDGINQD